MGTARNSQGHHRGAHAS